MRISAEELLKMLTTRQLSKLAIAGRLTLNEVRIASGLKPIEGADKYYDPASREEHAA